MLVVPSQRQHAHVAAALHAARGQLLLSPFVRAELDYLLDGRVGSHAALALLAAVARGAYRLEPFDAGDVATSSRPSPISMSVLRTRRSSCSAHWDADVLTLDERHFRTLRGSTGRPFRMLPVDATT